MKGSSQKGFMVWILAALMVVTLGLPVLAKETVVWWNRGSTEKVTGGVYKELADRFTELNPDIEIELVAVSDIYDKLFVSIAADASAPDLFTHYFSNDLARNGWIEDLTPYFERDGIVPHEVWFPISVERISYNGRYYAIPLDVSVAGMGYNRSIIEAAGLPSPGEGYNTDDFLEDLRILNRPELGIYGLDYEYRGVGALLYTALASNLNVQLVSENGQTVVGYLDSKDTLDAFEWWADVHRLGLTQPTTERHTLWGGRVAFGNISLWEIAVLRESDVDWDIFPAPVWPGQAPRVWADSMPTYMYAGSPRKEAAWQFMKWLSTDVEAGRIMAKYFSWAPPMVDAWYDLDLDRDPIIGRFFPMAQMPAQVPNYLRSEYQGDIIRPAINDAWNKAVVEGVGSLRAMLQEATRAVQAQLDDNYGN